MDHHVTYQESCDQLGDWLHESKDKMLTCSDVSGDAQTVEEKLARVKARGLIDFLNFFLLTISALNKFNSLDKFKC